MSKTVIVTTNDPQNPQISLGIGGKVESFAAIHPNRVVLFGPAGTGLSTVVTVTPSEKHPFRIRGVSVRNGGDQIRYRLETVDPGPQGKWRIHVENAREGEGRYYETLVLETDSALRPEIEIPVYGNIFARGPEGKPAPR